MFTSRGQALANLMGALRTLIDQSDDALGPIPVLGLLAVPDINERMEQYPALSQRFRISIPFDTGDDQAPQIDLAKVGPQQPVPPPAWRKTPGFAAGRVRDGLQSGDPTREFNRHGRSGYDKDG